MPCPVHGGTDGLRTFQNFSETGGVVCNTCGPKSDGIATLMWINNWDFTTTIEAIKEFLKNRNVPVNQKIFEVNTCRVKAANNQNESKINKIIAGALKLDDPKAETGLKYLKNRGLNIDNGPNDLLFHPNLKYWEDYENTAIYPCLVGVIRNITNKIGNYSA